MEKLHPSKKLIFDVITDLLNEKGLEAVTFSNISARAYLQRASVAYHFKSRQDMLNQYYAYLCSCIQPDPVPPELSAIDQADPVGSFCRLIDGLFGEADTPNARAADAISAHILIASLHDEEARRLVQQGNRLADAQLMQALVPYIRAGIIEESRVPLAMADLAVYSATESFIHIFGFDIAGYDLALQATIERVKRAFLKDGLYPPSKSRPD